ncbi:hypothetical protein CALCODRAFT_508289 [Calocera cornea HHB12733]|uniref:Uncharacterized protein n=1 Tax=Calocera cornea HHB12733 TaxID=1353952 RepID=A0A165GN89_9BASI|nr:hypothetical protein CALCODRAFT_508289 [Calocera cornea HHB12733]
MWEMSTIYKPPSSTQRTGASNHASMSPISAPTRAPEFFRDSYHRGTPVSARFVEEANAIAVQHAVEDEARAMRQYNNAREHGWGPPHASGSGSGAIPPRGFSPSISTHDPSRSPVVHYRNHPSLSSNSDLSTPTYGDFAHALHRSMTAAEAQSSTHLRKPTPEIIDLTASPAPSRGPSRAATPVPDPSTVHSPPPREMMFHVPSAYERPLHSYTALSKVWTIGPPPGSGPGPFPRLTSSISPIQRTIPPLPMRRPSNLPPDPKEVIDLSAMSDQEDEERQDTPPSSVRVNPRTAAPTRTSPENFSADVDKLVNGILRTPESSDDESSADQRLHLKVLKAPDVFTVGEAHYSCSRATLKKEPRVLSKAEEREVTEWYKGAYNRRQQQLEQIAKGIKPRGRHVDPEAHRDRPNRGPFRISGAFDPLASPMDFNPPPPPGMRFPLGTAPMVPPMMSNIHFVPYINNAKLPPLTTKGNGALVPGTCRKLFRRYRLEMCHGCDTKQRCSKKDMWKIPDPNDPTSMPPEPPASSNNGNSSRAVERGYPMMPPHPDMMMQGPLQGMRRPLHGMGLPPNRGLPPDMHPSFFPPPPPHGPYPPAFPHMHPPPPGYDGYEPYPPPPGAAHGRSIRPRRSSSMSRDRSSGPSGAPHGPSPPAGAPAMSPHRSDMPHIAGQKRPASPRGV